MTRSLTEISQLLDGGSLTHQNLPLAIFWRKPTSVSLRGQAPRSKVSNEQIISSLGIGIVRFNDEVEEPEVDEFDYEYRVDTDIHHLGGGGVR